MPYPSETLYPSESLYPGPEPTRPRRKPPLELDVEVETADGFFRLPTDSRKAGDRPRNLSFSTQRGDGFGPGSCSLSRQIFKDYPDVGLLDTWRFVGRNGDIAYEGRMHSNPRTNDPQQQIDVSLVGWMTYLKNRKIASLIIDRRLDGWGDPSMARRAAVLGAGYSYQGSASAAGGSSAPAGIIQTLSRLAPGFNEIVESVFDGGGEEIGEVRYDGAVLSGIAPEAAWDTVVFVGSDDSFSSFDSGTNHHAATVTNQAVVASAGRKYVVLLFDYTGAAAADGDFSYAWRNLRILGQHGLTAHGTQPEEGFYLTDIFQYILATYAPKITWAGETNPFSVTQATWHDNPAFAYDIFQQLNELALWELSMWEERKLYYQAADLTKYDWQIRTDDPGVSVVFQGDSIENFANGVTVTYTDILTGAKRVLYPSEHSELADESESNPANRHGEELWTDAEVPWQATEVEALQFGRAYLAEFNRPKRPGTYRISGGYIEDSAGHWHPGWKPRSSETIGILDHPDDSPRLIFATDWDDESKTLTVTVDAPEKTLTSIVARHELAFQSRGLS